VNCNTTHYRAVSRRSKPIIDRLSAEIGQFQAAADVKSLYEKQGLEPYVMSSEQFSAYVKTESTTLDKVIKAGNIKFGAP